MNRHVFANKITIIFLLLFFAFGSSVFANALAAHNAQTDKGSLTGKVDRLFARWSQGDAPAAAVMIIQGDKILFKKGYGLAHIETKTPIKPGTSFLLASVTKQFTAMAIMILEERGKLKYDDPLA